MPFHTAFLLGAQGLAFIKRQMDSFFPQDAKLMGENSDFDHHGWFVLRYEYLPKKYRIAFEAEFNSFHICIENEDNGFIALAQLLDYDNALMEENIISAITKMKARLDSPISFYKCVNGKLFHETDGQYKRVKDRQGHKK